MAAYLAAKARLFGQVMAPGGNAVLNADVPEFESLREISEKRSHRVCGYGVNPAAELRLLAARPVGQGQELELIVLGRRRSLFLPLAGGF